MNILFIRLSYIGDILHATPAARWIKQHYPDAKLHWIVTPSMVELLEHNPYVDEIIPWERDEYEAHSKQLHIPTMWRMWWELRAKLKPYHFDVAVDVQGRLISGLVLLASGAPVRLGLGGTKELNWLFTNYKSPSGEVHVIKRYLQVVQLLSTIPSGVAHGWSESLEPVAVSRIDSAVDSSNILDAIHTSMYKKDASTYGKEASVYDMDFYVDQSLREWADSIWSAMTKGETIDERRNFNGDSAVRPLKIGLVLGTSWKTKEWPQEKWFALITSLQYRANFICLGGPKEAEQYSPLMEHIQQERLDQIVVNMMGKTTLQQMGALIESCDIIVSADTGALHMAQALNKPVVALFGPTDPKLWGPLTGRFKVIVNDALPCLGCRKRRCPKPRQYCMCGIEPVRVKKAIFELIGDRNGKV